MAALRHETLLDPAQIEALQPDLRGFAEPAELEALARALASARPSTRALVLLARTADGTPVALVPLGIAPLRAMTSLPVQTARILRGSRGVRVRGGYEEAAAHALADALVREHGRAWDVLDVDGVSARPLLEALARAFADRGRRAYVEEDRPGSSVRLRAFNETPAGLVARAFFSMRRRAGARARALDPERPTGAVRRAASRVATYRSLHLYRGELFARESPPSPGLKIRLFPASELDVFPDRAGLCARLALDEGYALEKWRRGDTVVLAEADGLPVGILWCAHAPVMVPAIGREVKPGPGECYIHDVYVAPEARGRAVAPAMLDFLARELRARDVYRAWALIERSNVASTRAFEKAAYASVADVIFARMGRAGRLIVRPPDPEARRFLGLPPG